MPIMRADKDVTREIEDRVEARRRGPAGKRQRDSLYGILTRAILAIDDLPRPWLDDCISESKRSLEKLRDAIPRI